MGLNDTGTFADFMAGIEQTLLESVKQSSKAPEDFWENMQGVFVLYSTYFYSKFVYYYVAFSAAINWNEYWIRGLLSFHVICLLIILLTRKCFEIQMFMFIMITVMVFLSEWLNSFCSLHWRLFSTQNYFDEHGVFAGTLYSGPLLLISFIQLVNVHELSFTEISDVIYFFLFPLF